MFNVIGLICFGAVCYFAYKHGLVAKVKEQISKLLPR